jgi:hypothetical protein
VDYSGEALADLVNGARWCRFLSGVVNGGKNPSILEAEVERQI